MQHGETDVCQALTYVFISEYIAQLLALSYVSGSLEICWTRPGIADHVCRHGMAWQPNAMHPTPLVLCSSAGRAP